MRKTMLTAILTMAMMILAACGAEEEVYEEYYEEIYEAEVEKAEEIEEEPAEEIAAQPFLEDLDYMLYVLENNFALFDVAYWARGVDIRAIVDNIRAEIEQNPEMDEDEFFRALTQNFAPLSPIGHFEIISPNHHHDIVTHRSWESWFFSRSAMARLREPHVLAFYEPRHNQPMTPTTHDENWADDTDTLDWAVNLLWQHGEYELAEEFAQAWTNENINRVMQISQRIREIAADAPNVTTRSIEEGRIAYLSFNSFWEVAVTHGSQDIQILDFFERIRDYEHLILDFRWTSGGSPTNFTTYIMGPNIENNTMVYGFAFLSYGPYVSEYVTHPFTRLNAVTRITVMDSPPRPIAEMLEVFDIPELNMADMERMDYGLRVRTSILARPLPRFDNQPAFNGQIWMLTGPQMMSAVQVSAWIARETSFATLVGDITGGAYGGPRTFVTLPNSGIAFAMDLLYVTDIHGRPLEAGTIPHYFSRPGMDALETVLAMIDETS